MTRTSAVTYLARIPRALAMVAGQLGLLALGGAIVIAQTVWAALTSDSVAEALAKLEGRR